MDLDPIDSMQSTCAGVAQGGRIAYTPTDFPPQIESFKAVHKLPRQLSVDTSLLWEIASSM
ncbi:MAG: hypothetical protein ACKOD2_03540 [Ilumatobacteraceae bacterium]